MCRFAAFFSTEEIPLYSFLIPGGNSFILQSLDHPDGWGISHYHNGQPEVMRSILPAIADPLFEELCFAKQTKVLLGHIRRATTGNVSEVNSHPFRYEAWTFMHNGQIANFDRRRKELVAHISPPLRSNIKGTTDSEVFFYLFMTKLQAMDSESSNLSIKHKVYRSVKEVVTLIRNICDINENEDVSSLSFLLSNGSMLCGLALHKNISFREETSGKNKAVYFSSEAMAPPMSMRSVHSWRELAFNQFVFVDKIGDVSLLSI